MEDNIQQNSEITATDTENFYGDEIDRRGFLKCMAWAGSGVLFTFSGGLAKTLNLSQIASRGRHNVRPWFEGKIQFAPIVPDLTDSGFILIGGRTDVISGSVVPVLNYGVHAHRIDVYETNSPEFFKLNSQTVSGFNMRVWSTRVIHSVAISGCDANTLNRFESTFVAMTNQLQNGQNAKLER